MKNFLWLSLSSFLSSTVPSQPSLSVCCFVWYIICMLLLCFVIRLLYFYFLFHTIRPPGCEFEINKIIIPCVVCTLGIHDCSKSQALVFYLFEISEIGFKSYSSSRLGPTGPLYTAAIFKNGGRKRVLGKNEQKKWAIHEHAHLYQETGSHCWLVDFKLQQVEDHHTAQFQGETTDANLLWCWLLRSLLLISSIFTAHL